MADVSKGNVSAPAAARLAIGELLDERKATRRYRSATTRERDRYSIWKPKEFARDQKVVDFTVGAASGQLLRRT